jgi:DNA-binding XRE family transcriptional regulator
MSSVVDIPIRERAGGGGESAVIVANAEELGSVLRRARRDKGMTQAQLAAAVDVSRQWVIAAEAGAPTARLDLVLDALRAVDLVVDVVTDEPDDALDTVLGRARD